MADVACFCGCCFSFDGVAGACPTCGEVAKLTGDPEAGIASGWPGAQVPAMTEAEQNVSILDDLQERAEAGFRGLLVR